MAIFGGLDSVLIPSTLSMSNNQVYNFYHESMRFWEIPHRLAAWLCFFSPLWSHSIEFHPKKVNCSMHCCECLLIKPTELNNSERNLLWLELILGDIFYKKSSSFQKAALGWTRTKKYFHLKKIIRCKPLSISEGNILSLYTAGWFEKGQTQM